MTALSPGFGAQLSTSVVGREMLARDWSATAIGAPESWPASLTALVAMMLASPRPMFLAWGERLEALYNDAYLPILGRRAAGALALPFRTLWGDIWNEIGPLAEATLAGEARVVTDMPLDLRRQGVPEESWWTFSYAPVRDDAGEIAGLLCITAETTKRVRAERARIEADERLQMALSAGNSIGAWDWDVPTDHVTADHRFALLYGVDPARAAEGAPIAEFFKGIHPEDRPRIEAAVQRAMATGDIFAEEYRLIGEADSIRWVSAQGQCVLDGEGRCLRFPGVSFDITRRMMADLALRAAKEEREFVVALTTRQRQLQSPEAILRLSLEEIGKRLGLHRCGFYRALPGGKVRAGPCWTDGTMAPLVGEFDDAAFGQRVRGNWASGQTLTYADSRADTPGDLDALAAIGVVAGACVPMMREGRFYAGFFLHSGEVRAWSASDVALIREIAELTLLAVERAEAMIRMENRVGQQEYALAQQAGELREETAGRAAAESQLRQLQKMEAVGQLTGGIAHDFNNMLAVVISGMSLLERRIARGDTDVGRFIEAVTDAAHRAAALTQRLLAFSRQAPLAPEPVDANRMIAGLSDLLTRTLGETLRLETVLGAGLWKARADLSQLENVIVNLSVNARDAMAEGGKLTIETNNAYLDDSYALAEELKPGQYVLIAVSDTGSGMSDEVMGRAFEPFFTTKGVGKGTGLGLSQVYGFARQSGGHVKIYSELGHGTTIKLYLPRHFGEAVAPAPRGRAAERGGAPEEVIFVVEDDARLRAFTVETLRELGYSVVQASDGAEALAMIDAGQRALLLFTDVVMPGITGRQLAEAATAKLPGLKVLYTTGYTRNAIIHNGTLDPGTNFLAKPFGMTELATKLREVLDA